MTIAESFDEENLEISDLADRTDESEYWEKCFNFVNQNWDTEREELSPKQNDWLQRIIDDLIEYRINKRTKNH